MWITFLHRSNELRLPSFLRRNTAKPSKKGKSLKVTHYNQDVICLPTTYSKQGLKSISTPRGNQRIKLAELGLQGKVTLIYAVTHVHSMSTAVYPPQPQNVLLPQPQNVLLPQPQNVLPQPQNVLLPQPQNFLLPQPQNVLLLLLGRSTIFVSYILMVYDIREEENYMDRYAEDYTITSSPESPSFSPFSPVNL